MNAQERTFVTLSEAAVLFQRSRAALLRMLPLRGFRNVFLPGGRRHVLVDLDMLRAAFTPPVPPAGESPSPRGTM